MTPREYLKQLTALVAAGDYDDALAFAERWSPSVYPQMSGQEYQDATTLLELPSVMAEFGP
jgi:hypothetical protein